MLVREMKSKKQKTKNDLVLKLERIGRKDKCFKMAKEGVSLKGRGNLIPWQFVAWFDGGLMILDTN